MGGPRRQHFLMLGDSHGPNLLGSYGRALRSSGAEVSDFDLPAAILAKVPFRGRLRSVLHRVLPHEPWFVQGNRDLVRRARQVGCTTVVVGGAGPVRAGALAQIKTSVPGCKTVLMWPDPMQNLQPHVLAALPMYDVVCTYSSASVPWLYRLGARRVEFLPFAADTELFQPPSATESERRHYGCDISFVGGWRVEREQALLTLVRAGLQVKIWGDQSWRSWRADQRLTKAAFQGSSARGRDFALAVACPPLTLNVVDDTNYPAANMRSFEALACRGALVSTPCPEWESEMVDGEVACFYDKPEELVPLVRRLLGDSGQREHIRETGYRWVTRGHTYRDRAQQLLGILETLPGKQEAGVS